MITSSPQRIEEFTRQGWWGDTTVHQLLFQRADEHPQLLAVADQPNRASFTDGSPQRLNYADLRHASVNLAAQLLQRGIGQGDVLVVQLPNVAELVVCYFAASIIGAVISPLPVQYGAHELGVVRDALSPVAMITTGRLKDTPLAQVASRVLTDDVPVLVFAADQDAAGAADAARHAAGSGLLWLDPAANESHQQRIDAYHAEHPPNANHTLSICWTSGTTGKPKGVPRSHNMWLATGRNSAEAGDYRYGDRLLNPFPLVNMAALGGFFFPFMLRGCSLILHHPFDPPVFLKQMQDERITFTIVPPAVLNQLAKAEDMWNAFDFRSLRRIGSGSAPLAPWMIDVFDNKYHKKIVNFYGSNEGISLFSTPETSAEPEVRASMFPRMGCQDMPWIGITHMMVKTRIARVDSEEEITQPGEPGELLFYGPTVFDGYHGKDDTRHEEFTSDGWFRTGDLVEICGSPPHYYRIVGRCKDIINRGGMKISPSELDVLLEGVPQLAEAAVCAYPDDNMGEKVCACVVPLAGQQAPDLQQINEYLLSKGVAKFKLPEKMLVLESLPRNPVGKVQRHELEQKVKDHG